MRGCTAGEAPGWAAPNKRVSYIAVLRRQLLQEGSGAELDLVGGRGGLRRAGAEAQRDLGMSGGTGKRQADF